MSRKRQSAAVVCWGDASPTISNCEISYSDVDGVRIYDSACPTISPNNIFEDLSDYGVRNYGSATVNACNNWWGDASGPHHETLNPDGTGMNVSDNVDFSPYLTAEPAWDEVPVTPTSEWVSQNSGVTDGFRCVHFIDSNTGWVVGGGSICGDPEGGLMLKTTDGGETWTQLTIPVPDPMSSVYFINESFGWAVGGTTAPGCKIIHTTDGGATWSEQTAATSSRPNGIFFIDQSTGWIRGDAGTIQQTTDGGISWVLQTTPISRHIVGHYFVNANTGWAGAHYGTVIHTTDGGNTWTEQDSGIPTPSFENRHFGPLNFVDANNGWIIGANGVIVHTTDGGANWSVQNSNTTEVLLSVYFVDSNNGWVVGANGLILRTTDGGATWTTESSGTEIGLSSVCFVDQNTGWAVGSTGTILKYTSGGGGSDYIDVYPGAGAIQTAINGANESDTILVHEGTYTENVVVNESLTLIGDGSASTTVSAQVSDDHVFNVTADYVNISGFTVQGASSNDKAGIYLGSGVDHCNISDNNALNNDRGIYIDDSNDNTLTNNIASNNNIGIYLTGSSYNTITNNIASNNSGIGGTGIFLTLSSKHNTLANNTIRLNLNYGIELYYLCTSNDIMGNTANSNNNYGIYLHGLSNDNNIYNNYFNNTNNAWDNGTNSWNITKTAGTNIVGGSYLGGNYWGDYEGEDSNGDGLGDTSLPYNSSGGIQNGGDWLPLTEVAIIAPPTITSFSPPSPVSDTECATRTFNVTIDRTVNVSWLINGTEVHSNTDVISASYTNTSVALGVQNVSAVVSNANGTDMQTWIWNVAQRVPGDVTGNGVVNIGDAVLLFNWVSFPDERGTTYVLH